MKLFKSRQNIQITRYFKDGERITINTTYGLLESTLDAKTFKAVSMALETLADETFEYTQISIIHEGVDVKVIVSD